MLATVVTVLAVYQLTLIAIAYGRLRPPFLDGGVAGRAHRTVGDSIVAIAFLVATMCVSFYGFEAEEDSSLHVVAGTALLVALALKIVVVRWWHGLGGMLPYLGTTVFVLFALTWATSAGDFLID